jgi:acyl-CoA thioester hydrolase
MTSRTTPPTRDSYPHFCPLQTRWMDNDVYGHLNNVIYYSLFDTVINRYLINEGSLDIHHGAVIGLAVQSWCNYVDSVAYPDELFGGLRVGALGRSSVSYEIGIFRGKETSARAFGAFTHVFVERTNRRSTPITGPLRAALERILIAPSEPPPKLL